MQTTLVSLTLLPLAAGCLLAQSVVATADRTVTLPPDQAVFSLRTTVDTDRLLPFVLEALTAARVGSADLVGKSLTKTSRQYLFRIVRPAAAYEETRQLLQLNASARPDLRLEYSGSTQVSSDGAALARTAALPELFAAAKTRAERMLIEAGYRHGPILELAEFMETAGNSVRFTLVLRMARLDAPGLPAAPVVSTQVTPPATPYRIGPPAIEAAYYLTPALQASVLPRLAAAGFTTDRLTSLTADPDFRRQGPVGFRYSYSVPAADETALAFLNQLPAGLNGSASVVYPVTPAPEKPVELLTAARNRAALLAGLLTRELGDYVNSEVEQQQSITAFGFISGSFNVIPAARIVAPPPPSLSPVVTPPVPTYRYRFGLR